MASALISPEKRAVWDRLTRKAEQRDGKLHLSILNKVLDEDYTEELEFEHQYSAGEHCVLETANCHTKRLYVIKEIKGRPGCLRVSLYGRVDNATLLHIGLAFY